MANNKKIVGELKKALKNVEFPITQPVLVETLAKASKDVVAAVAVIEDREYTSIDEVVEAITETLDQDDSSQDVTEESAKEAHVTGSSPKQERMYSEFTHGQHWLTLAKQYAARIEGEISFR